MHGQHGDPRHHVLEPAVGLEPADAPAELSSTVICAGQRLRIDSDQRAQQRYFPGGEVAAVIAALDPRRSCCRHEVRACAPRSSTMAATATGRPAAGRSFFAHASSHAVQPAQDVYAVQGERADDRVHHRP